MRGGGYQSIPSASSVVDDGIENGMPPSSSDINLPAGCAPPLSPSSNPPPSAVAARAASLLPSVPARKDVGLVSVGIIVGCVVGSRGGMISRNGSVAVDDDGTRPFGAVSQETILRDDSQLRFVVGGKSFLDSLPFEDVVPRYKSPRPPPAGTPSSRLSSAGAGLDGTFAALSPIIAEVEEGDVAMLGLAVSGAAAPAAPHILYHATSTAFGLLYDSAKSANGYLSEYALDYFLINSGGFDAQINQAYCAVASVATILNSLKYSKRFRDGDDPTSWSFDLPTDPRYDPYPYATQQDVLAGDCVWNNVVEVRGGDGTGGGGGGGVGVDGIFKPPYGLGLEQAGKLLNCHTSSEWIVTVQNADPSQLTLPKMRYDLKAALIDPDARVVINFDRKGLGQVGGGHFSPLGAYHAATDSFLVLDVAKYKYPPVWVGADTLFGAMATVDRCGTYDYPGGQERLNENAGTLFNPVTEEEYGNSLKVLNCKEKYRGYIILKKKGSVSS